MTRRPMPISRGWLAGALLTYLFGFTALGWLAYNAYAEQPPIPTRVLDVDGNVLFTGADIFSGMDLFRRHGLMEYGSVYGHGAYLGPDFTADYLRRSAELLLATYLVGLPEGEARAVVSGEFHENTHDPATNDITWSRERAAAHRELVSHYSETFSNEMPRHGLQAQLIPDAEAVARLSAFFAWTAWTATANRPGTNHSYTNNWPPDDLAGNDLTAEAILWSTVSIIGLLGGTGVVFYFFGRYDWLGWSERRWPLQFRPIEAVALTPSQRATTWFFLVAALLFLGQTAVGGLVAHYRADPTGVYGWDTTALLPYNIARTWHLQLAIFWVTVSFLAAGIFIVPLIAGREPRHQGRLTLILLSALVLVVLGTLLGTWAGVRGHLKESWFWIGHQGWEYLDLGRVWQVLLILGLALWVVILARGLRKRLPQEHPGNMPWLLFYAALAIPGFYSVGLLTGRGQSFVVADFWRFWVVHLWVEDFLELFTTILVAYLFVLLGMVRERTAIRVIYLDVILYSVGGVIGTMHHLYFSGTPTAHMAWGATFSALEVLPLLLLTLEAWSFMRSGEESMASGGHPHRWAVWFLIAVGVWNFLGAGVFGFLINLPVVSYYEIGTALTANHAHTAMMGVYGMLGVGLALFCLRYQMRTDKWSDRAAALSFWSLNIGLVWMSFANLFPLGIVQFYHSISRGYHWARSPEFLAQPWINRLEWLRLPGDVLFIIGGVLPLVWICVQAIRFPNPARLGAEEVVPTRLFTEEIPADG